MTASIQLLGEKSMRRAFERLEPTARKRVFRKAVRKGLKKMLQRAKAFVPKVSGDLLRSLKVRAIRRSRVRLGLQLVAGGDRAPHAFHVETGTRNRAASPFLRPAFDAEKEQLVTDITTELNRAIDEEWAKR